MKKRKVTATFIFRIFLKNLENREDNPAALELFALVYLSHLLPSNLLSASPAALELIALNIFC